MRNEEKKMIFCPNLHYKTFNCFDEIETITTKFRCCKKIFFCLYSQNGNNFKREYGMHYRFNRERTFDLCILFGNDFRFDWTIVTLEI